ncbi:alpha-ketoglutarate-dependent dioxygenase AlkB [Ramlibacter sp. AW1]|uniref:Alpha-ketoglutarate-dependent dioxygenase AlkB n=1 Tax=Ramlibacter aurantiacus TaxID=2801330 RepID=A0A936ZUG4_9BURK|nr:alpha-ketoglutarate-dependent dioxygenase AlkB [Ramlibacter aurantiacus]MBL0422786.1 alpha-ketoglutarate-dependent dioxygenase AlkB [Ramlibacter aurantiacus]
MQDLELDLFGGEETPLPEGMRYQSAFLSAADEQELLEHLSRLPLQAMDYKGWQAQRRVASFGSAYDFTDGRLRTREPIPEWLLPLRDRIARWAQHAPVEFADALVAEYSPGTPLGWHRDVPEFEDIVGVSLLGTATMRLRLYPPPAGGRPSPDLRLRLAPRSIYLLHGPGRWAWQHRIMPTPELRYSITFRTRRQGTSAASRSR